jgi:hypothetical protein
MENDTNKLMDNLRGLAAIARQKRIDDAIHKRNAAIEMISHAFVRSNKYNIHTSHFVRSNIKQDGEFPYICLVDDVCETRKFLPKNTTNHELTNVIRDIIVKEKLGVVTWDAHLPSKELCIVIHID